MLGALLAGVDANGITHPALDDVVHQKVVILQAFILVNKWNKVDLSLNVLHLNKVELDIRIEVFLPGDLGRLGRLNGDDVFLLKLKVSNFLKVYFGKLSLRLEQLDIVFFPHNWNGSLALEYILHFVPCLRDEKVRLL